MFAKGPRRAEDNRSRCAAPPALLLALVQFPALLLLLVVVPHLVELNIGHSLISRSLTVGLTKAVKEMLAAMRLK